jgi:hypothetical protein
MNLNPITPFAVLLVIAAPVFGYDPLLTDEVSIGCGVIPALYFMYGNRRP